jgi:hypothetical protein
VSLASLAVILSVPFEGIKRRGIVNISATEALENTKARTRTWQEETNMLLSMIDCLVLDREAVYASSEFTTGKRFYELCRQHNVRTKEDLKKQLGKEYETKLLLPNKEEGIGFARRIRGFGRDMVVLTPNPLFAPGWSQPEYLGFWEEVIQRKCHTVYFNEGWEYSNGCTFEYLVGAMRNMPLLDHIKNPLPIERAREMTRQAIASLEKEKFSVPKLREVYEKLNSL